MDFPVDPELMVSQAHLGLREMPVCQGAMEVLVYPVALAKMVFLGSQVPKENQESQESQEEKEIPDYQVRPILIVKLYMSFSISFYSLNLFGQRPQRANVLKDTGENFQTSVRTSVRPSVSQWTVTLKKSIVIVLGSSKLP